MVREGLEFSSPKCAERLSRGAIVEELELVSERLKYRRLSGTGPEIGWISWYLEHKELAVRISDAEGSPCDEQAGDAAAGALALENVEEEGRASGEASAEPELEDWEAEVESRRLALLPHEVDEDLRGFAWNHMWRRVNAKGAFWATAGKDRETRLSAAQECADRMNVHLRAVEQTRALSRRTLRHIDRQVDIIGDTTVQALKQNKWLLAAQAKALEPAVQFSDDLWSRLVVALRSAAVAIFFISGQTVDARPHTDDFFFRWAQLAKGKA